MQFSLQQLHSRRKNAAERRGREAKTQWANVPGEVSYTKQLNHADTSVIVYGMGRRKLGSQPSVVVTLRIPGEWAEKLAVGGKTVRDVVRGLIEERMNGSTEHQSLRPSPSLSLDQRSIAASGDAPGDPRPKRKFSELELAVAERTGCPPGHGCFQCAQTLRFLYGQRESAEPPKMKRKGKNG
jgi:hypothetical protein